MIFISKILNSIIIFILFFTLFICIFFIPTFGSSNNYDGISSEIIDFNPNGFVWPLPGYTRISSYFGKRKSPTSGASSSHSGIDIPAPEGTQFIAVADGEITLTDTVAYENLVAGMNYKLSGTLMNKETGEPLLDADGNEITAEATFTPEESNGTVDVEFTFDLTGIESGTDIVVFESLYHDGIEVAVHADIDDEDQTIHIIDVQTEAESQNGTHTAPTGSEVTIIDHVSYTNLEVGKEYKVSGKLMNKETGEPLFDADGNEITAETTFTPEESNGVVDLEYTLDSSLLAGKEIVVFEDLYKDDILVASHADIEDENQTIKFKNWEILVNKVDSITGNNIISKEFEFTMYSDEDLQEEVITKAGNTEDGTALFEITEGTWYIKETRAPEGYKLSDEVVKVEVKDNTMYVNDKEVNTDDDYLYSIVYQNVMLPSTQIKTGTHTNTWLFVGIACISGLAIVALVLKRKRS